jgi:Winged helix DNA-binding domain
MTLHDIACLRLINQQIAGTKCNRPSETVSWLGAMQAQDYLGVLWSIGLRSSACTEADVEQAIADRTIVRTWPMRGTLHFVCATDVHWMLQFLAPPAIAANRRRQEQQLELDDKILARCRALITKALQGGRQLNRPAIYSLLEDQGISTDRQRGYHVLWRLAQEGIICFGAREGRQPTFTLLEEWIGPAKRLDRDEALATLAKRYFAGHGPATVQDFAWWSGLTLSNARTGLEMIASTLRQETDGTNVYWLDSESTISPREAGACLLPGFDEYLLGYNDRQAAVDPKHAQKLVPDSNGRFLATMVLKGRVVGTWKRTLTKKAVQITLEPFASLSKAARQAFGLEVERYGKFIGLPVEIEFVGNAL